jgi:hypothetical protein
VLTENAEIHYLVNPPDSAEQLYEILKRNPDYIDYLLDYVPECIIDLLLTCAVTTEKLLIEGYIDLNLFSDDFTADLFAFLGIVEEDRALLLDGVLNVHSLDLALSEPKNPHLNPLEDPFGDLHTMVSGHCLDSCDLDDMDWHSIHG